MGKREFLALIVAGVSLLVILLGAKPERNYFRLQGQPHSDAAAYDDVALNLLRGHGFTRSDERYALLGEYRPLYPLFLALVYTWIGHRYNGVVAVQVLLGVWSAVLVFLIGERVFGRWIGLATAGLFILDGELRNYYFTLMTEPLGLWLTLSSVWFLLIGAEGRGGKGREGETRGHGDTGTQDQEAEEQGEPPLTTHYSPLTTRSEPGTLGTSPDWWPWALAGIFFGLSNLARTTTLLSFPFYLLALFYLYRHGEVVGSRGRKEPTTSPPHHLTTHYGSGLKFYVLRFTFYVLHSFRSVLHASLAFGLAAVPILLPWILRNQLVLGMPSVSINTPELVWAAANPDYPWWTEEIFRDIFWPYPDEPLADTFARVSREAKTMIREHPGYYLRQCVWGVYSFLIYWPDPLTKFLLLLVLVPVAVVCAFRGRLRAGPRVWLGPVVLTSFLLWVSLKAPLTAVDLRLAVTLAMGVFISFGVVRGMQTRPKPVILLLTTVVGPILAMALVAGATGERLRLMIDWIFLLFFTVGVGAWLRSLTGKMENGKWKMENGTSHCQSPIANLPRPFPSPPSPPWFHRLRRGLVVVSLAAVLVSMGKVAYGTAMRPKGVPLRGLSDAAVVDVLTPSPLAPRPSPLTIVNYDKFMRARAVSRRNAAPEYVGGTVAWTGEIVPLIAHFPANEGLDRDLAFHPRPYPRTVFQFVVKEHTAERGRQIFYVLWPGRLPDYFRHRHVILIGRLEFHEEAVQKSRWPILAAALVPLDEETGLPEMGEVLMTGGPGDTETRGHPDTQTPTLGTSKSYDQARHRGLL